MTTAINVLNAPINTVICKNPLVAAPDVATREPIAYTVQFNDPQTHYVDITMRVATEGQATIEAMMPVWTPGSYMLREYSRNVEAVSASADDGTPLPLVKAAKNRWHATTRGAEHIVLRYRVYGREMTVRNNWIERDFALLNGAATFMTLDDGWERFHDVRIVPPKSWHQTVTGLPQHPDGSPLHFRAPNFDVLVDSPIVSGTVLVQEFDVGGKHHVLATQGAGEVWDADRAVADVKRIVKAEHDFWGVVPYAEYTFINVLAEGAGGLEHGASTVVMGSRWSTRDREDYLTWVSVIAHEFFHTWNVKRLRPAVLGPFDYEHEAYTSSLWVVEGITSYYDDLLVHRAGISTPDEYLKAMSKNIERLQSATGRLVQPMDQSSFDAWIKLYRPDENSANVSISYYTKGAVVAWLLDLEIRKATDGKRSLDDLMREAYERWSGNRGYTEDEFQGLLSEIAGKDMSEWLRRAVSSTEELQYEDAMAYVGLRFKPKTPPKKGEGNAANDPWLGATLGWLGVDTKSDGGRIVITKVPRVTPAFEAGLNVDDEIIGIGGYRVRDLEGRLKRYRAGDAVEVLIARRDELMRIRVKLGAKPIDAWDLEVVPDAPADVVARRDAWLAGTRLKNR